MFGGLLLAVAQRFIWLPDGAAPTWTWVGIAVCLLTSNSFFKLVRHRNWIAVVCFSALAITDLAYATATAIIFIALVGARNYLQSSEQLATARSVGLRPRQSPTCYPLTVSARSTASPRYSQLIPPGSGGIFTGFMAGLGMVAAHDQSGATHAIRSHSISTDHNLTLSDSSFFWNDPLLSSASFDACDDFDSHTDIFNEDFSMGGHSIGDAGIGFDDFLTDGIGSLDIDDHTTFDINPASGLPMVDSTIDCDGNAFGTSASGSLFD